VIGLDTNILVRYITQDEPEQAAQATRLIEASCTSTTPGRVAHIVPCGTRVPVSSRTCRD
jgi:predicted nucleic-acid-binding protein